MTKGYNGFDSDDFLPHSPEKFTNRSCPRM